MKDIICFFLVGSFFIVSCDMETVIDLDIPPHESVLVLNGLLDTDTSVQVVVSHSVSAFNNAVPSFINNANVLLYKQDQFIDSLFPDLTDLIYVKYYNENNTDSLPMYYYRSDVFPDKDAVYRVEVYHSDYTSILAETYVPDDIILYNIDVDTNSSATNPEDEENIGLTFTFDDNPSQQNYYQLRLFGSCKKKYDKDDDWGRGYLVMLSNDPSFPADIPWNGYTFVGNEVLFTDDLFNAQSKTITLDVETKSKYSECDTIFIEFSTFSDDTYSYYNSLGNHSEKGELGIFGGEVIPVYSNVKNGLGVLISTNTQQIYLKP